MHPKQPDILPYLLRQLGVFLLGVALGRLIRHWSSNKALAISKQTTASAVHTTYDNLQRTQESRDRREQT